jgi:hypothetical protein
VSLVWLAVAGFAALVCVPLAGPLHTGWRCLILHQSAERERAEVVGRLEHATLALAIVEGAHAGQACTADTSDAIFEATHEGDTLEVVYLDWKPGECELISTLEASAQLLWVVSGTIGLVLACLLAFGVALTRSFTRPVEVARRLPAEPREVRCPACGKQMDEGYVPILAGLHWRRPGQPIGLPHALAGLPGTVGWRGRPRLHAFRCAPCEILTLQYGDARARRG